MPSTPTPLDDVIYGTESRDVINGLTGNDLIYGLGGNDDLSGGDGNDELFGGEGDDSIGGNEGNDILHGGTGEDLLYGVQGSDIIYGDDGNDILVGDIGDDTFYGGRGNDRYFGGPFRGSGTDTTDYGFDRAVIDTTVNDAIIEFARSDGRNPVQTTYGYEPFIISSDGIDTFDRIDVFSFNDVDFSANGYELTQTYYAYSAFMGRKPTTAEYAFWNSRGAPVGLRTTVNAILDSAEGRASFGRKIDDVYHTFAGRGATAAEVQDWNTRFHQNGFTDFQAVRSAVVGQNDAFVSQLIAGNYQAIFGRAPTAAESATWKSLFVFVPSSAQPPYGFGYGDSHATPDTLINALMSDAGSNGHIPKLSGTGGADVFTLPADFTDVYITGFDPTRDRISFDGTAFAGRDPFDPAAARQTTHVFEAAFGTSYLDGGGMLIQLDATHRILVGVDREQYLSRTTDTIDTYYQRYFGRDAYTTELDTWNGLFDRGQTYDTLIDTLLTDAGSGATATQKLAGTAASDRFVFGTGLGNAVITVFDASADTIDTRGTAYAGIDPLTRAREIVGLDGSTDVLIQYDATHAILLDHIRLAQLGTGDFLF